jgi:hypothetical protein
MAEPTVRQYAEVNNLGWIIPLVFITEPASKTRAKGYYPSYPCAAGRRCSVGKSFDNSTSFVRIQLGPAVARSGTAGLRNLPSSIAELLKLS